MGPTRTDLERDLDLHREELASQNEELRRLADALRASSERNAQLWGTAPTAYFTVGADGSIVDVNQRGARLVGRERPEVVGTRFEHLVTPAERSAFRSFVGALREGETADGVTVMTASGGRVFPAQVSATVLGGQPAGPLTLLSVTDDTERQKVAAHLANAQKMESLDVLAAGVAHDFNNLLSVILAQVAMITEDHAGDVALMESLAHVREAGVRAAELSRQMLAYCGGAMVKARDVDPAASVRGLEGLLRSLVGRSVVFVVDVPDGLPAIRVDPTQLHQLLMNLVINASEALGLAGGRISLRASVKSPSEERLAAAGQFVCFEVEDDGPGMSEATRQRVFEPFFSTKFIGRGLGLAVVRGCARSHGGVIELDTAPGEGARFRVFLPMAPLPAARSPGSGPAVE